MIRERERERERETDRQNQSERKNQSIEFSNLFQKSVIKNFYTSQIKENSVLYPFLQ
jgi:hypothetical protein